MEMVLKQEPISEDGAERPTPPGASGGGLPAAAAGGSHSAEEDCVISLLSESEEEPTTDEEEGDEEEEEDWDAEEGSEDESDVEPCAVERPGGAAAPADVRPAADAAEPALMLQWEAYPSLAKTAGQEPPGRTSGLQVHKSCEGTVVQILIPASTGNVCPHTVGVFSCRQAAARARDVAHAWRALHGVGRATWESCQWAYPEAKYQEDEALLSALRALTQFRQLRAAVRQLFPPPLSLRQGRRRRHDRGERPQARQRLPRARLPEDRSAVEKVMTEAALKSQSIRFKAEDFQLLGWRGSIERLPRLLLTLCEGAEPAAKADSSPLSPGSRGRSPIEVEFGVLGRDGARMATASATRLLRRLSLQPGDVLYFEPAPASSGPTGEGRLAAQLSVVREQEQQQHGLAAGAAPGAPAAAVQPVAASNSGGHAAAHRRKGAPARVAHGLRWAGGAAGEAAAGAGPGLAAAPALTCANCGCTETYQWRPMPGGKTKRLCGTCRAYCDNHGGKMRPSHLWAPWKPREVKVQAEECAAGPQHEPPAKRQRVQQPAAASPAGAAAERTPAAVATPGGPAERQRQRQQQQRQQQQQQQQQQPPEAREAVLPATAPAAVVTPPAAPAAPAAVAAPRCAEAPLPADASWERCHARLDVLLSECAVDELDAQDFKFALLDMPEEVRRSHFLEVQARHAEGKPGLACRWVARVLSKQ